MCAEATNGDGFGIGWYDEQPTPACSGASSPPGTTRISRAGGTHHVQALLRPHPSSDRVVGPANYLALSFGLEDDPAGAVARTIGLVAVGV